MKKPRDCRCGAKAWDADIAEIPEVCGEFRGSAWGGQCLCGHGESCHTKRKAGRIVRGQGGRVYFGGGFDIHEKLIMREKAE